ncbi:MAG: hypothetical protein HC877_08340 [Thioploca sp.]|nr:hypothetical protein [Thioploca sp.]
MSTTKIFENQFIQQPQLRYEQTSALYASQFVISATGEEVIINFSSGTLTEPNNGETYLPIHTRIALSVSGARKLVNLLNQALSATQITSVTTSKLHN